MIRRAAIYTALVLGAFVFVWPFLWMVTSSAKVDRELFGEKLQLWPQRPIPQTRSPYLDERHFADVNGPRVEVALPIIEQILAGSSYRWPEDLDRAATLKQTARGLYRQLVSVIPNERWSDPGEQLRATLTAAITPTMIGDVLVRLRRVFCVGQLRARSYDLREDLLVAPENAATAWQIGGTAKASMQPVISPNEQYAELSYDFAGGDTVVLSQTFRTSFPAANLHRLQMSLRYDDTWHALTLFVEKNGRRYRAERALELSDPEWILDSWQERGPDDRPEKIRTWTLLSETDRGPQFVNSPNEIKVILELRRHHQLQAWWSKIRRNYRMTLDFIPFWRYAATSLFLVLLNLIGTLFTCSLVAYSFARLRWPGRSVCFALMLATMMIPAQVTMIPQFLIMQKLGWYNTLYPLWITSFAAPAFYVFLLRQFLKGVPRDLEDAARLDGCGFLRIYWHIMLPLVRPTLAAIAIFTFTATWNEFMGPLIYLADQRLYPLSFGLYALQVQVTMPGTSGGMGVMMAASLLMTLPVIAIFFFAQRYFLQGVTLTGMKG